MFWFIEPSNGISKVIVELCACIPLGGYVLSLAAYPSWEVEVVEDDMTVLEIVESCSLGKHSSCIYPTRLIETSLTYHGRV
jgi:hypothetical protein